MGERRKPQGGESRRPEFYIGPRRYGKKKAMAENLRKQQKEKKHKGQAPERNY